MPNGPGRPSDRLPSRPPPQQARSAGLGVAAVLRSDGSRVTTQDRLRVAREARAAVQAMWPFRAVPGPDTLGEPGRSFPESRSLVLTMVGGGRITHTQTARWENLPGGGLRVLDEDAEVVAQYPAGAVSSVRQRDSDLDA